MSRETTITTGNTEGIKGVEEFNADAHMAKAGGMDEKEMLYEFSNQNVKKFNEALKNGNLPCQPKQDGYCDTSLAHNLATDRTYHGINQMILKIEQKIRGYKTAEFVTMHDAEKAAGEGRPVFKHGVEPIYIMAPGKEGGEKKFGFIPVYSIETLADPKTARAYFERSRKEFLESKKQEMEAKGEVFYEPRARRHDNGLVRCNSTDPAAYIGQWQAAAILGKGFKVTPEQAASFKKNCGDFIWQRYENGKPWTSKSMGALMKEAGERCKEYLNILSPPRQKNDPERTMASPEPEMGR